MQEAYRRDIDRAGRLVASALGIPARLAASIDRTVTGASHRMSVLADIVQRASEEMSKEMTKAMVEALWFDSLSVVDKLAHLSDHPVPIFYQTDDD